MDVTNEKDSQLVKIHTINKTLLPLAFKSIIRFDILGSFDLFRLSHLFLINTEKKTNEANIDDKASLIWLWNLSLRFVDERFQISLPDLPQSSNSFENVSTIEDNIRE